MRFGLIGAGSVGQLRAAAIRSTLGCSLDCVFDKDRAAATSAANGAAIYDTEDAMLAADSCDAVVISTPPAFHEATAVAALESGKHVLVEKPMSNSLGGCRSMIDASRRAGKVLTVGFNHRYFDAVKVVRDAVVSGKIGRLSYVRGFTGHTGLSEFKAPWMYDKDAMGGGTLLDNGIHMIDLVRYILGEVESVYGIAKTDIWNLDRSEDNAFALMHARGGAIGSLHASWSEWKGYRFFIEAYGDKGMARAYYAPMMSTLITMDRPGGPPKTVRNFYLGTAFREKFRGWQSTVIGTFQQELSDFVARATGGEGSGIIAGAEDGFRAIEIANAVYQATESGQQVRLQDSV